MRIAQEMCDPIPLDDELREEAGKFSLGRETSQSSIAKAYASDDPLPVGDEPAKALAKRAKIDSSQLYIGMAVKGLDGQVGRITKINGAAVSIEYDNGSGIVLASHVEAA